MRGLPSALVRLHQNAKLGGKAREAQVIVTTLPPLRGGWSAEENDQLRPLGEVADRLSMTVESGSTDEGEPWYVLEAADGRVALHVARVDRRYVVAWPHRQGSVKVSSLSRAVDVAVAYADLHEYARAASI